MRILAFDTETTGLDPQKDRITEFGWALWQTESASPLVVGGGLVRRGGPSEPVVSAEITKLTGITEEMREEFGAFLPDRLSEMANVIERHRPERIAAHNAEFDRSFLMAELERVVSFPRKGLFAGLRWIDTKTDLPVGDDSTSSRLNHLAADHGFVNPFRHRAAFDALTACLLLQKYPLDEVLRRADSPTVTVYAHQLPFERRTEASKLRFRWSPETHGKVWFKEVKECDLDRLRAVVTFDIRVASTPKARVAA